MCLTCFLDDDKNCYKNKKINLIYINEFGAKVRTKQTLAEKFNNELIKCSYFEYIFLCEENKTIKDFEVFKKVVFYILFQKNQQKVCRSFINNTGVKTRMKFRSLVCSIAKTIEMSSFIRVPSKIINLKEFKHSSAWSTKAPIHYETAFKNIFNREFKTVVDYDFEIIDRSKEDVNMEIIKYDGQITREIQENEMGFKPQPKPRPGRPTPKRKIDPGKFIPFRAIKLKRKIIFKHDGMDLTFDKLYEFYSTHCALRQDELKDLGKVLRRKKNTLFIAKSRLKELLDSNGEGLKPQEISIYKTFKDMIEKKFEYSSRLKVFKWIYNKFKKEKASIENEMSLNESVKNIIILCSVPENPKNKEKRLRFLERLKVRNELLMQLKKVQKKTKLLKMFTGYDCTGIPEITKIFNPMDYSDFARKMESIPFTNYQYSPNKEMIPLYFQRANLTVDDMRDLKALFDMAEQKIREFAKEFKGRIISHDYRKKLKNLVITENDFYFLEDKDFSKLSNVCDCKSTRENLSLMHEEDMRSGFFNQGDNFAKHLQLIQDVKEEKKRKEEQKRKEDEEFTREFLGTKD
jgi:hypothetical protein